MSTTQPRGKYIRLQAIAADNIKFVLANFENNLPSYTALHPQKLQISTQTVVINYASNNVVP
jgi:hypothetical protein